MHIGQFGCSKKYRSGKRPCSPGQQCSEALQIVPPGGHLPEKVTIWSMPRILQLKLFSCLDHVVRQSSVCSEQSEMSGEGQGSAKIRQEGGAGNRGGAIPTTWLAGGRETWDSTNTFLSCCLLLFEGFLFISCVYMLLPNTRSWNFTRSAGPRAHPAVCSRSNSADTFNGKLDIHCRSCTDEHEKEGKDFTSAGSPDSRTLKLSSLLCGVDISVSF